MARTDEELARLAADDVPRARLIWTAYFFTHTPSTWDERQAFREALFAADFTGIGSDEELTGDGCWHHWSHTIRHADPDQLRIFDEEAAAMAAAHGVRYDQWEICRDLRTGELLSASPEDDAKLRAQDAHRMEVAARSRERRSGDIP